MRGRLRRLLTAAAITAAVLTLTIAGVAAEWPAAREMQDLSPSSSAPSAGTATAFPGWRMLNSPLLGRPVIAWGTPVAAGDGAAATVLGMITRANGDASTYSLESDRTIGALRRLHWSEQRLGLPVLCGRADATLNSRGEVMRWSLRSHADFDERDRHLIDEASCAALLAAAVAGNGWTLERGFAAWLPDDDARELVPVYWLRLAGPRPDERWEGIVSAISGEVVWEWPGIATETVSGNVTLPYWQPYIQSEPQIAPVRMGEIYVDSTQTVTDANGAYTITRTAPTWISSRLSGPYVDVQNEDAPAGDLRRNLTPPFVPTNLQWSTNEAVAPELNLFYHVEFIHGWYKVIDPAFSALDYPMPAVANVGSGYDNAYWNGFGIYFGSGSEYQNFAMFSDVIYHEYTHGVTDGIYPNGMLPYIDQPGALNEAWSDYIACSINGDPLMGEYLLQNNPFSAFRDLENDLVYPRNWSGEVHADSRFVSGALWRIRAAMGAAFTDPLAHFARYGLAETFLDYLVAVLETDDDDGDLSNGTPHAAVIYHSFGVHGIGPGELPWFQLADINYFADGTGGTEGDGDRFMEQGERFALSMRLQNLAPLYPPPATGILIQVQTTDADVQISGAEQSYPTLPAGSDLWLVPIQVQINPGSADRWLTLTMHITSNGGAAVYDSTLQFAIGQPRVLIVNDDPASNVAHYVVDAARRHGPTFERVSPLAGEAVDAGYYPEHGLVIWLSGNQSTGILSPTDQQNIAAYLAAGNKVVLSGQNIVDELAGTPFAQQTLGVDIAADSLTSNAVTVWNTPFPVGEWYLITGSRGASNQREASGFAEFGESRMIARYGRTTTGPGAVIEFANGNGLLFGFGLEAVSGMAPGSAPLDTLLQRIYDWAGIVLDAPDAPRSAPSPNRLALSAVYPNPFNNSTALSYSIPANQRAALEVFDVLGRDVESRVLTGEGVYHWTPQVASGVYFVRLRAAAETTPAVKVMLMK
jgi:hypothetical protein